MQLFHPVDIKRSFVEKTFGGGGGGGTLTFTRDAINKLSVSTGSFLRHVCQAL